MDPASALAEMQYSETLARRIVAVVALSAVGGQQVMLHEVARQLKVDEASAEAAMHVAIARGWLKAEGCSLYRISLTGKGWALLRPR